MKKIKSHVFLLLSVLLLSSCSTPDNIFTQITGIGSRPGEELCYVPAEAYCSDDKKPSPAFPEKPKYASVDTPSVDEDKIVLGSSYGVKPDNENNSEAFVELLDFCRKSNAQSIKLQVGDYYFGKGNLVLSGLKDFIFDGNGASFLINQENVPAGAGLIQIENCSNLVFKNIKIGVSGKRGKEGEAPSAAVKIVDSSSLFFDSVKISSVKFPGFLFAGKGVRNVYMVKCGVTSCESGIRITETGGLFFLNSCSFRNNREDSVLIDGDSSHYLIKNCFFYHNQKNDLNIKASKIFVTNCTFMHTGAIPILINSKAENVIIDENVFDGANTKSQEEKDPGAACIAVIPSVGAESPEISRVLIEENKLLNFPHYSISLESVNDATIKGNLFVNRNKNPLEDKKRGGLRLDNVNNAIVRKNLWEGKENLSPGIYFNPNTTKKFILEDNIKE